MGTMIGSEQMSSDGEILITGPIYIPSFDNRAEGGGEGGAEERETVFPMQLKQRFVLLPREGVVRDPQPSEGCQERTRKGGERVKVAAVDAATQVPHHRRCHER